MTKDREPTNSEARAKLEAAYERVGRVVQNYIWRGTKPCFLIPDSSMQILRDRYPLVPDADKAMAREKPFLDPYEMTQQRDFLTIDLELWANEDCGKGVSSSLDGHHLSLEDVKKKLALRGLERFDNVEEIHEGRLLFGHLEHKGKYVVRHDGVVISPLFYDFKPGISLRGINFISEDGYIELCGLTREEKIELEKKKSLFDKLRLVVNSLSC